MTREISVRKPDSARSAVAGWLIMLAFAAALMAGAFAGLPAQAADGHAGAKATVETLNKTLLATMKQGGKLGYKGRYRKLEPVITGSYNLKAMAAGSLGPAWDDQDATNREPFVEAFTEFTIANYANRFKTHDGEKFVVTGAKDGPRDTVLVLSHIEKANGEKVNLNYLLRAYDGKWKIVDVFLNGTFSELATKRAEYGALLGSVGIKGLTAKINERTAALGGPA